MQKKCKKIWSIQKKAVLLHAFSLERVKNPLMGTPKILIFGESGGRSCPFI